MNERRINRYESAYMANYGFESTMVHYRRALLLERLEKYRPRVVVEIGCGLEPLYDAWLRRGGEAESWIVVEPAEKFASNAKSLNLPNLHVICDLFEDAVEKVRETMPRCPDFVICSSLLHEVPSANALLAAIHSVMDEATLLHVNVPNSDSFHRRLAKAMGLISDTKAMSERNTTLLQHRVYSMVDLKSEMVPAGFEVVETGGYFVKPFTHAQMEGVVPVVGNDVLDGLYLLGKEEPELASEIFVEAIRAIHE
jgi:hypothetical protein